MRPTVFALAAALCASSAGHCAGNTARAAEGPAVVATIVPLHSLVAGVMDGVAAPHLLLSGSASPHAYALRPSDSRRLARARAVFWIGEALEAFLARPLAALTGKARVVEALAVQGLVRLPLRQGGPWDDVAHDRPPHDHGGIDAHVWLDPANARAIVAAAASALAGIDPANAARYAANAKTMDARLQALDARLKVALAPIAAKPYVVFHDAYQYFERRYGLGAAGAVTLGPGRGPGARRLIEIRARIRDAGAACVFIEPQFEPRIAQTVVEGTGARIAVLDPLGAALTPGREAYFTLMETLAAALTGCLGRT